MWRKNKIKTTLHGSNHLQDKLATRIAGVVLKIQTLFSSFLSKRTANLSARSLKIAVLFFSAGWFAVSVYFITSAFVNEPSQGAVQISHIKKTSLVNNRSKEKLNTPVIITGDEYREIQQFQKYMDSLRKYSRQNYDSILSGRPGLMDSVILLEQLYNHPKK